MASNNEILFGRIDITGIGYVNIKDKRTLEIAELYLSLLKEMVLTTTKKEQQQQYDKALL